MSIAGKTVLITGGGSGIGAACAVSLAQAGCKVAISGRRREPLEKVAASFSGTPAIEVHPADASVREQAFELVEWATQTLGRIDILLNAAGINTPKRMMSNISPDDWDKVMQVNATSAFNTIYATLPQMRERKDGIIVNISSVSGLRASPLGGVAYNASKFAMTALGTCVGHEERNNGIRVTNVYPGEVETPIMEFRPVMPTAEHRATMLQPEDIAAMVLSIVQLPPRAHVPDIIIKPTVAEFI
ncbi:SDR family oxidoreductase [Planctomicrobium sp. SH668]|uniref:SDR family oxidoreductase n=1 Tax=Planctomicrobium sp. SH668 TaxID=3448126 RepID=UPI003F5C218C